MIEIFSEKITLAVEKLCFDACTCLNSGIYDKILSAYHISSGEEKKFLKNILINAEISFNKKKPLCQDTGQVIVFVQTGNNVTIKGDLLEDAINKGIEQAYKKGYFRKSVVRNAVFNRVNTNTNTPGIIYTKITEGDTVELSVLIKGAGSENKSKLEMMLPVSSEEEIVEKCSDLILQSGENSCPPMFIGICAGASADMAMLGSKQVFVSDYFSSAEIDLAERIKASVNKKSKSILKNSYVLDVKFKSLPTHIACMPVAITLNCHSDRISKCTISEKEIIHYHKIPAFVKFPQEEENLKSVDSNDTDTLKTLSVGDSVLLSGEIIVARDAAHKRLYELIKNNKKLPFELKNKIIFYAGPCPAKPGEISGSIGPTTASRMDKFAQCFYSAGIMATIGKGNRSKETAEYIRKSGGRYLSAQGGIAALLSEKILKSEIIAYEDLGAEAIYRLTVKDFPVKVEI